MLVSQITWLRFEIHDTLAFSCNCTMDHSVGNGVTFSLIVITPQTIFVRDHLLALQNILIVQNVKINFRTKEQNDLVLIYSNLDKISLSRWISD